MNDTSAACARSLRLYLETEVQAGVEVWAGCAASVAEPANSRPLPSAPAPSAVAPKLELTGTTLEAWGEPDFGGVAEERLATIAKQVAVCTKCSLSATRKNTVPGEGNPKAEILFIGEGPGADEDLQGRPFVGAAGQLLDKMIVGMGFQRSDVFIANVVKCRPPGNRTPTNEEAIVCGAYLAQQIAAISPRVIVALGATPYKALTGNPVASVTRDRGKVFRYRDIPLVPTFHPSYVLRADGPAVKQLVWQDLKQVLSLLGRSVPRRV